jgi:hypothetical protein
MVSGCGASKTSVRPRDLLRAQRSTCAIVVSDQILDELWRLRTVAPVNPATDGSRGRERNCRASVTLFAILLHPLTEFAHVAAIDQK